MAKEIIKNLKGLKKHLIDTLLIIDENDKDLIKLAILNKDLLKEVERNKYYYAKFTNKFDKEDYDINMRGCRNCDTALIISCAHNNIKNVTDLLNNGADINLKNNNYMTPLAIAVLNNNVNMVHILLGYGANKSIECYNDWPAKFFTINPDIIKLL